MNTATNTRRTFITSLITALTFVIIILMSKPNLSQQQQASSMTSQTNNRNITNNWAVLVSSSKYWFNYRHAANVLSIYRSIKRLGIDDSHIILMLADDMACDARNPWPGTIFNNAHHHLNVYGEEVEVDFRGDEVTVENFIRLLTNRHFDGTPKSKKLLTDSGSNILIYLTGHGGNGFLKFQDKTELTSTEIAEALEQMNQKQRYNEILFIVDTCQAESMSNDIHSPNIIGIGSSKTGQDSLSHHGDSSIGVYVIDRFTYYVLNFLEKLNINVAHETTLRDLFKVCPENLCMSNVKVRLDLFKHRDPYKVPITDFFGNKNEHYLIDIENEINWMKML